jgi:hypothetical protein
MLPSKKKNTENMEPIFLNIFFFTAEFSHFLITKTKKRGFLFLVFFSFREGIKKTSKSLTERPIAIPRPFFGTKTFGREKNFVKFSVLNSLKKFEIFFCSADFIAKNLGGNSSADFIAKNLKKNSSANTKTFSFYRILLK